MKKEIPVIFTFDNNFVVPAIVAIYSMLRYASRDYYYRIFIVHSDISEKSQKKLSMCISEFEDFTSLEFLYLSEENGNWDSLKSKCHYSKEIYNKLLIADIFPQYEMVICSDVDVVFLGDISGSYTCYRSQDDFYLSGVNSIFEPEILSQYTAFSEEEKQIIYKGVGAGYIVLNLGKIRQDGITEKMKTFYRQNMHRLIQPEQDVLNICCFPKIRYLPYKYLICIEDYSMQKHSYPLKKEPVYPLDSFMNALEHPVQLHYAGFFKPWNSFFSPKQSVWFRELIDAGFMGAYLMKLPFFLYRRSKNYSLRRFCKKIYKRLVK